MQCKRDQKVQNGLRYLEMVWHSHKIFWIQFDVRARGLTALNKQHEFFEPFISVEKQKFKSTASRIHRHSLHHSGWAD
jgi:hypothetical protein